MSTLGQVPCGGSQAGISIVHSWELEKQGWLALVFSDTGGLGISPHACHTWRARLRPQVQAA